MSIRDRYEPKSDDIMDLIMAYEQLRLNALHLLDFVKSCAAPHLSNMNLFDKDCDGFYIHPERDTIKRARDILKDLGEL